MRKIALTVASFAFVLVLAGCGEEPKKPEATKTTEPAKTPDTKPAGTKPADK